MAKRSKTKLLEMVARQGATARAELLQTSEREQFLGGSLRYLCDLLGVQESDAAKSVVQAAERIRAMQTEVVRLHGELAEQVVKTTVIVGLDSESVHQRLVEANANRAPGTCNPLAGEVA